MHRAGPSCSISFHPVGGLVRSSLASISLPGSALAVSAGMALHAPLLVGEDADVAARALDLEHLLGLQRDRHVVLRGRCRAGAIARLGPLLLVELREVGL